MSDVAISYQRANPDHGNESFLLRFQSRRFYRTPCLLVDAGHGVDVESLLTEDDDLKAILLTHSHRDHYQSLANNHRKSTPVLTSPTTKSILADVFDVAEEYYGVGRSAQVLDSLQGISDWTPISEGIDVCPIPAGHTPGAAGFCIRVATTARTISIVITGDFTRRRAAGFPGFDPDRFLNTDILFLTGTTNERFEPRFTAAVEDILTHVTSGGPVLVTASGLTGVQLAYVLSLVQQEFDINVEIRVIGQVAKHYDNLDYALDTVTSIPVFDNPQACLAGGTITIAGPEVPIERSSGTLFERIEQEPSAALVQVTSGSYDPITSGGCAVSHFEVQNHPPETVVNETVETLEPIQTVITHQRGRSAEKFVGRWKSFVWAGNDAVEQTLYEAGSWRAPPKATRDVETVVRSRHNATIGAMSHIEGNLAAPSLERVADGSLAAEGIATDRLTATIESLTASPDPVAPSPATPVNASKQESQSDSSTQAEQSSTSLSGTSSTTETQAMTANSNENSDESPVENERKGDTLFTTVSASPEQEVSEDEIELTGDSATHITDIRARSQLKQRSQSDDSSDADSQDTDESGHEEPVRTPEAETGGETDSDDPAVEPVSSSQEPDSDADDASDPEEPAFDIDPVLVALLQWVGETVEEVPPNLDAAVDTAVERHLESLLRGEFENEADRESSPPVLTIEASPALETAIAANDEVDDQFTLNHLVQATLVNLIPGEIGSGSGDLVINPSILDTHLSLVDSALENDAVEPSTRAEFIQKAIREYVATVAPVDSDS